MGVILKDSGIVLFGLWFSPSQSKASDFLLFFRLRERVA